MKKKKKMIIASAVVVIAIAGILGYVLWPDQNPQVNAAPMNTSMVTKGNILVGVSGSGSVSAINSESIRTKEAGEVDTVMVKKAMSSKRRCADYLCGGRFQRQAEGSQQIAGEPQNRAYEQAGKLQNDRDE